MIDKNKGQGLGAAAAVLKPRLEERIRRALLAVPKDKDLVDRHPNATNRTNVRRRLLLKAVLDVVFDEFINRESVVTPEGVKVTIPDVADPWAEASSEFCAARRDFMHDAERLDNGAKAELICAPGQEEGPEKGARISAKRKLLLLSLIVLENRGADCKEPTRLLDLAEITGFPEGTIRTSMRHLRASLKIHRSGETDIRQRPWRMSGASTTEARASPVFTPTPRRRRFPPATRASNISRTAFPNGLYSCAARGSMMLAIRQRVVGVNAPNFGIGGVWRVESLQPDMTLAKWNVTLREITPDVFADCPGSAPVGQILTLRNGGFLDHRSH